MNTNLAELYSNKDLYPAGIDFYPPAERVPHSIIFELDTGCSYNRCTYCEGFKGVPYRIKTLEEYQQHVDDIFEQLGDYTKELRKIFIGGADAIDTETEVLHEATDYTIYQFIAHTGRKPDRVSLYGRTDSIKKKGPKDMKYLYTGYRNKGISGFLKDTGLTVISPKRIVPRLIYWGVESGSDEVLEYVDKGYTKNDILESAEILNKIRLPYIFADFGTLFNTSVMIMPGLGGKKFYEEHIEGTVDVLNAINPRYLTFMGINPPENSAYAQKMEEEIKTGANRPLTEREMSEQMISIIENAHLFPCTIGCFGEDIDAVGHNPLPFGSVNHGYGRNISSKKKLIESLKFKLFNADDDDAGAIKLI